MFKINYLLWSRYIALLCVLLKRDLFVLRNNVASLIIDGLCTTGVNLFVFGYLMPLAGMSVSQVAPLYCGLILQAIIFVGASRTFTLTYDRHYIKFIQYRLMLPLPKDLVIAEYIIAMIIDMFCVTMPLLMLALFFVPLSLWSMSIVTVCLIYLASLIFCATMFVGFSFLYTFNFVTQFMWPRRLAPIIALGPILVPWSIVVDYYPLIGYGMLLNPFTYFVEGLRFAMLGSMYQGISLGMCVIGMIIALVCICLWVNRIVHTRLDLV